MKRRILLYFLMFTAIINNTIVLAEEKETYESATEYDYPPFSVTTRGEADGFSVELLQEVMNVMGLEIAFKIDEWNVIKQELEDGELDILPLVGYTEEREKVYDFTVPYIVMHGNIFVRDDNESIRSEDDLYDKQIIVMEGDNAHEYAVRIGLSDNLVLVNTYEAAFKLLSSGKYDAILAQSLVGEQLIKQLNINNVRAVTKYDENKITDIKINLEGFEQKFCFAVQEGDSELLAKLNEGLAIVSANGTYDQLYKKWFPFLIKTKPTFWDITKVSMIFIFPGLILILLLSVIYFRRQIKLKSIQLEETNKSILAIEAQLRNKQKLESIGVLASGVAHEINNPLNGIMNYGQIIYDIVKDKEFSEDIDKFSSEIINETKRIEKIVENLLLFSAKEPQYYYNAKISEVIEKSLSLINTVIKNEQIEITLNIPSDIPAIECRPQQLQQVIINVLLNSRDALNRKFEGFNENKKISIKVERKEYKNKDGIRIIIEDTGTGISERYKDNVFDPFFTTKNRTEGTGLGLSISYGIINEHNGEMSFETEEGEYTRFFIDLPTKQNVMFE